MISSPYKEFFTKERIGEILKMMVGKVGMYHNDVFYLGRPYSDPEDFVFMHIKSGNYLGPTELEVMHCRGKYRNNYVFYPPPEDKPFEDAVGRLYDAILVDLTRQRITGEKH